MNGLFELRFLSFDHSLTSCGVFTAMLNQQTEQSGCDKYQFSHIIPPLKHRDLEHFSRRTRLNRHHQVAEPSKIVL